ncbi:MAG: AAA family ATPase [Tissierellia bacterium]|nr:AAA family ATPase [Tissierellia bacterium]
MIWIKKIEIMNFQSHIETELNLSNGLNIIIGPSDTGKTSILRALKWVLYNEPLGTGFITHNKQETAVTLTLSDDTKITRLRDKTKNRYIINDTEGNESIFEGFGTRVPYEIQRTLGIYSLDGNFQNINLSEQLEGPFLIMDTGAAKAVAIGKLVGVDIIDNAQQVLNRDQRGLKTTSKNLISDITGLEEQCKEYDGIEEELSKYETFSSVLEKIKICQSTFKIITNSKNKLRELEKIIEKVKDTLESLPDITALESVVDFLTRTNLSYQHYNRINTSFKYINEGIKAEQDVLINLDNIEDVEKSNINIIKLNQLLSFLLQHKHKFEALSKDINQLLDNIDYYDNKLALREEFTEIFKLKDRLNILIDTNNKWVYINESYNKGISFVNSLNSVDGASDISGSLIHRNKLFSDLSELMVKKKNIEEKIKRVDMDLVKENATFNNVVNEYEGLIKESGKCPFCHQPLDSGNIKHIVEELM